MVFIVEARERHAEKPHAFTRREKRCQQIEGPLCQLRPALHGCREGPAPRDLLKILKLDFQRHGSTSDLCLLTVAPNLVDDGPQLCGSFGAPSMPIAE